ncbi:MAG: thymidylate synthase [Kiritimatiellaeota bacterium]|nr:thymidylate synthase [Kiritimatiellota bacterium]
MNIPVLTIQGRSLAETFEKALTALYVEGVRMRTQYDKEGDPLSVDATMNMTIADPMADPMIHKAFPGGIADLREYVYELEGRKDEWVKAMNDPEDTRWEYTYHGRLQNYGQWKEKGAGGRPVFTGPFKVDQIEYVIAKLCDQPFTRQAQMITWMPSIDLTCYDPPCLQSIWYRLLEDRDSVQWLNVNVRFRSNDAWGANFMNMFGFTMFNRTVIADEIARRTGKAVRLGRMNWQADSFHIYGKDIEQAEQRLFNRIATTTFEERVYHFADPMIQEMYHEDEAAILQKIAEMNAKYRCPDA